MLYEKSLRPHFKAALLREFSENALKRGEDVKVEVMSATIEKTLDDYVVLRVEDPLILARKAYGTLEGDFILLARSTENLTDEGGLRNSFCVRFNYIDFSESVSGFGVFMAQDALFESLFSLVIPSYYWSDSRPQQPLISLPAGGLGDFDSAVWNNFTTRNTQRVTILYRLSSLSKLF